MSDPLPIQDLERKIRLPLEDSNLDYLIQSAGPRATKTDKLTGRGVPTSIGALSVWHLCPLRSGETLAKHLQRVLAESPDERSGEHQLHERGASVLQALHDEEVPRPRAARIDAARQMNYEGVHLKPS